MIPQSETPPLALDIRSRQRVLELVPPTVRFLRSGCPSVQWVVVVDALGLSEENRRLILDVVQDAFSNLQMPGENFKIQTPTDEWKPGTVFTINRLLGFRTETTTFGKLERGDQFLTGPNHRSMAVWDGRSNGGGIFAVPLEGPYLGELYQLVPEYEVYKIID